MSWKPIIRSEIGEGTPRVRIAAHRRGPSVRHAQITLHVSVTLAKIICVKPGDRVTLEIGTLADHGWMRLSKGNEQKAGHHGHRGQIVIKFSGRRLHVEGSHPVEEVKFRTHIVNGKGYLLFLLPKWTTPKGA